MDSRRSQQSSRVPLAIMDVAGSEATDPWSVPARSPADRGLSREDEMSVYTTVLASLLSPPNGQLPPLIELYSIDPERHSPATVGFGSARPFERPDVVPLLEEIVRRSNSVVRVGTPESLAAMGATEASRVVRVFVGHPELVDSSQIPEEVGSVRAERVVIEVGFNAGVMHDRHNLWCLSRADGAWRVEERRFIWMS